MFWLDAECSFIIITTKAAVRLSGLIFLSLMLLQLMSIFLQYGYIILQFGYTISQPVLNWNGSVRFLTMTELRGLAMHYRFASRMTKWYTNKSLLWKENNTVDKLQKQLHIPGLLRGMKTERAIGAVLVCAETRASPAVPVCSPLRKTLSSCQSL